MVLAPFFIVGALISSYLVLRLLLFVCRELRGRPNRTIHVIGMGALTLGLVTAVGVYGVQHHTPAPPEAFVLPAIAATVIELVRIRLFRG